MAESAPKRIKTDGIAAAAAAGVLIGTHSGHFHADEALAVHMLRQLPAYADASLVRTRDPAVLATCHTVVDVGGEYDAARHRYDHHQRGFATTFPGRPTKLSSAGLVFLHFGRAIIARRLAALENNRTHNTAATVEPKPEDSPHIALLHDKIYESFVEALDAHDNGIAVYDPQALAAAGLTKRFSDGGFGLGALAQSREDARFAAASARIGEEFDREVDYYASAWLPARAVVQAAFTQRAAHDADGRVLVLEGQSVPWKDHLYTLEQEEGRSSVLYVLYQEKPEPGAKWRVQCVPESKDSFVSRKPLPEAWRGFRDAELDGITGIEGCVFVHAAGFIGGNATFDGAKAMVAKALAA
ncbi:hypothetical protein ARSEF1564_007788 [Beauveria bassiana]